MNRKNAVIPMLGLATLLFGTPGLAEQDGQDKGFGSLSGSALLATDYMFRGISNSDHRPQVRVDLTWSHPTGVYAGVWASNTDFGGPGNSMEIDPYIGFASSIADTGLSYDVGYWSYNYPGSQSQLDYGEFYAIGTYTAGDFSVSPSVWYSDNYFGDDFISDELNSLAYDITFAYELPHGVAASARVGEQTFGSSRSDLDYVYYDVGVSKTLGKFTLGLRWHDTDGVDPDLADPDLADGEAVASLTRNFD